MFEVGLPEFEDLLIGCLGQFKLARRWKKEKKRKKNRIMVLV